MKRILITLILPLLFSIHSQAQTITYGSLSANNNGTPNWIKVGTATMPQGGNDAYIRFVSESGYNARITQIGYVELHIKTSNYVIVDGNGFGFAATATAFGGSNFMQYIHIVPNASGVSASAYTIYAYCLNYSGNSFYSAEVSSGCNWANGNTLVASDPGGYNVAFEFQVNSTSRFLGNVGIGTLNPDQALTVNGQVHATSVVVTSTVPADYVFDRDYSLRPLADIKAYVDKNHHLPDVPAAAEFEKDGQNLGEMNMLLLRKVEELTLYMLDKDKEIARLKATNNGFQNELNDQKQNIQRQQACLEKLDEKLGNLQKAANHSSKTKRKQ